MTFSPLLTDFYQLTMAYAYWKHDMADREACFYATFRQAPFHGEYAVFAGLGTLLEQLKAFRFHPKELDYLSTLKGSKGQKLFAKDFLQDLSKLKLRIDLSAPEEGQIIFANAPWMRVTGPLLQTQLLETLILNTINFQTLIATKASRIVKAAGDKPIMEFGLRRAQGPDGGLAASRAAFIGGCQSTSNVLAGMEFGIPVSGTQAHSWIMCFKNEKIAFEKFAETYPDDAVFLVDTYHSKTGIKTAIEVAQKKLDEKLKAVRLDSGDLTYLSQQARKLLDQAGLQKTKIIASNDLDENIIANLVREGACIDAYGVGTKLVTAFDQPALGGVYKLSALKNEKGQWENKVKVSEQIEKTTTPGILNVQRYFKNDAASFDVIYDERLGISSKGLLIHPADPTRRRSFSGTTKHEMLLKPWIVKGKSKKIELNLQNIQARVKENLSTFHPTVLRLLNPHRYPVGLEQKLYEKKMALLLKVKRTPKS